MRQAVRQPGPKWWRSLYSDAPDRERQAAQKAFDKAGWTFVRQRGSHMILSKSGVDANLSVPDHSELDRGTSQTFDTGFWTLGRGVHCIALTSPVGRKDTTRARYWSNVDERIA